MKLNLAIKTSQQASWQKIVFGLIVFINLLFLLWSAWTIVQMPYAGMTVSDNGVVERVASGSPADLSGMIPGDVIIAVNGRPLKEMYSPYDDVHAGEWAMYTVIRDSQTRIVSVLMERLPWPTLLLSQEPVLLGFIFWLISLFVLLVTPTALVSQLFFLLGQAATLMFSTGAVTVFHGDTPENYLFMASLIFLSPLVAHSYLTFPLPRESNYRRLYLGLVYGAAGVVILAYTIDFYTHTQIWWIKAISSQRLNYVVLTLIMALSSLFAPRSGASIHSRRQQRLLIAGMLFSVLPVLTLSIVPEVMKNGPWVGYRWTLPFLVLLPISYAYAVHVENLDRFDYILKCCTIIVSLGAIYSGIYFILFGVLHFLKMPYRWCHFAAGTLMILFAILTIVPFKRKIDLWLDRFFYGHWYDYRSIIQQNSRYLSGFIKLDELAQNLLQNARTMRFKKAILFWVEEDTLRPYNFFGYPSEVAESFTLHRDDLIIQRLIGAGKPCAVQKLISAEELATLTPEAQALFAEDGIQILLPLLTRHNRLLGMVALGARQSNEALDKDDWAILNTLADQTSLAVENIHLVATLRQQLDVMQQMQQELQETKWRLAENRERERLELARILHDGPIQDIYSVIYQLAIWRKVHELKGDPGLQLIENDLMNIEKELRSFSTELRPPALEAFGLERAIRSHINKLQENYPKLEIHSDLIATNEILSAEKNLAFFRIYQESIRNAIRHANTNHIWVRLYEESGYVTLEIEDHGRGFGVPSKWVDFARQGHLGILGIAERAEAIGGQLEVISKPGQGSMVRVSTPVDKVENGDEIRADPSPEFINDYPC